jgi:hypothetical protein
MEARKPKPTPPEKIPTEHEEQVAFVEWFRASFPDVRIIAIPNGGARHPKTAADLKAEGVLPGVPDLFVPEWRLWIEMKRQKGGTVSEKQKEIMKYLVSVGYQCAVCRGADEAIAVIDEVIG